MAHEESDICGTRPFKGFNSRGISNLIYYCEFSLACTHFAHALHLIRMLINPIRFRSLPNDMIKKVVGCFGIVSSLPFFCTFATFLFTFFFFFFFLPTLFYKNTHTEIHTRGTRFLSGTLHLRVCICIVYLLCLIKNGRYTYIIKRQKTTTFTQSTQNLFLIHHDGQVSLLQQAFDRDQCGFVPQMPFRTRNRNSGLDCSTGFCI